MLKMSKEFESSYYIYCQRVMAWGELDICFLGIPARNISDSWKYYQID